MKPTHLMPALITALAFTTSAAQAAQLDASYSKSYGTALFGGSVVVSAEVQSEIDLEAEAVTAYAETSFRKKVKLLGGTYDVIAMDAWAVAQHDDGQLLHDQEFTLSVLDGIAVWTSETDAWAVNMPMLSVFPGNGLVVPVQCGPVIVKVKVNAGVDGAMGFATAPSAAPVGISLTGSAQGWAQGTASASATFAGIVQVGVKASLKLANLTASLDLNPNIESSGLNSTLGIALQPIQIDLDAYAKIILPFLPDPKYTVNLVDWVAAPITTSYTLN